MEPVRVVGLLPLHRDMAVEAAVGSQEPRALLNMAAITAKADIFTISERDKYVTVGAIEIIGNMVQCITCSIHRITCYNHHDKHQQVF